MKIKEQTNIDRAIGSQNPQERECGSKDLNRTLSLFRTRLSSLLEHILVQPVNTLTRSSGALLSV